MGTRFRSALSVGVMGALIVGAAISGTATAQPPGDSGQPGQPGTPPATQNERQRHAHPGHGHEWDERCGGWKDQHHGTCVHADVLEDPVLSDSTFADGTETPETTYTSSAATTGTGRCSGPSSYEKFHVLYVTTNSREDRYSSLASTLREKVQKADYYIWKSAEQTGGKRHVRFVCNSSNEITITKVVLSYSAGDSWADTKQALRNNTYNQSDRKYLAFLDWKERDPKTDTRSDGVCGRGEIFGHDIAGQTNDNNRGNMIAGVYLKAEYCLNVWGKTAMHEIGHTLGGVQPSAPRHDGQNYWHPRDEHDRMAYGNNTYIASGCGDSDLDKRFDCNDNDYFNTSPSAGTYLADFWNIARNQYLTDPSVPRNPGSLTASAVSSSQINLSWNDNSWNEDGFKIERSTDGGVSWTQIATVGRNVKSYSNTGLSSATTYHYRVRAYGAGGNSSYSNTASATTPII